MHIALGDGQPLMKASISVEMDVQDDDDDLVLSMTGCLLWLSLVTLLISVLSDYIMDAISGVCLCVCVCVCVCVVCKCKCFHLYTSDAADE